MRALVTIAPACAAVVFLAGGAVGAVDFDPETGEGFASRKDVRKALGWTNAELRERAGELSFAYVDTKNYRVVCRAGERSEAVEPHESLEKLVADRIRRTGQALAGYDLRGYRGQTSSTNLSQEEGAPCSGSDADGDFRGVWGPVEQVSVKRGLVVRYKEQERLLT